MGENYRDDGSVSQPEQPATDDVETAWEDVPLDPEVSSAFGYEWDELDIITAVDNDEKAVVLPANEDLIRADAFLIVSPDHVYDVVEKR